MKTETPLKKSHLETLICLFLKVAWFRVRVWLGLKLHLKIGLELRLHLE